MGHNHGISGSEKECRDGITWLFGAGLVAILLSLTLFQVDNWMTSNYKAWDRAHAASMRELRTAQSSLAARVTDTRQTQEDTLK